MGGRGSGGTRSTAQSIFKHLEGKPIESLREYSYYGQEATDKLVNDFSLGFANAAQIDGLKRVIRGILENDRYYDEEKTPYDIMSISFTRLGSEKSAEDKELERSLYGRALPETKDIAVSIYTPPHVDNAYIRMMDEKRRFLIIGNKGGYYTFDDKGKRKTVKQFTAEYGERTWK